MQFLIRSIATSILQRTSAFKTVPPRDQSCHRNEESYFLKDPHPARASAVRPLPSGEGQQHHRSDIQILYVEGVIFNKFAARLDLIAHQLAEHLFRLLHRSDLHLE